MKILVLAFNKRIRMPLVSHKVPLEALVARQLDLGRLYIIDVVCEVCSQGYHSMSSLSFFFLIKWVQKAVRR